MKTLIAIAALTSLLSGVVSVQSGNVAYDAHRPVNNTSAVSHMNVTTHEQSTDEKNKDTVTPLSEMNEHGRTITVHSFMNSSTSCPHQKMTEEHKKMLSEGEANTKDLSSSELNAGEKVAPIHKGVNNAGAEAH